MNQMTARQPVADNGERYLTPEEAGTLLKLSLSTLSTWRVKKTGPPYVKAGQSVRYPLSKLSAWLAAREIEPNTPAAQDRVA